MDIPKQMPNGQVIQQNMEVSGMEEAPTNAPQGDLLGMQIVDGKSGTVESIGLPQTDYTDGPAQDASEPSDIEGQEG